MADVCVKMKLIRGSFLLIILLTFNGLVDKVTSEGTEFETETESVVNSNEFDSQEINVDGIENEEIQNDEVSSDENDEYSDCDLSSAETEDDMDIPTGMQISADQITPIVNQLLGPLSVIIEPYLGPLAPLSGILSNVISQTVTGVVVNLINETVTSAKRPENRQMQSNIRTNSSYAAYLVRIPNNGRFLVIRNKTSMRQTKSKLRRKNARGCA